MNGIAIYVATLRQQTTVAYVGINGGRILSPLDAVSSVAVIDCPAVRITQNQVCVFRTCEGFLVFYRGDLAALGKLVGVQPQGKFAPCLSNICRIRVWLNTQQGIVFRRVILTPNTSTAKA